MWKRKNKKNCKGNPKLTQENNHNSEKKTKMHENNGDFHPFICIPEKKDGGVGNDHH
jgi:hypothetical protein